MFRANTGAPRMFTKVVAVVVYLLKSGLCLASYLGDWLAMNKMRQGLLSDRDLLPSLLFRLEWIVNKEEKHS